MPTTRRRFSDVCCRAIIEAIADRRQFAADNDVNAPQYSLEANQLADSWQSVLCQLHAMSHLMRVPYRQQLHEQLSTSDVQQVIVALRYALTAARSRILALHAAPQREARKDYRAYYRLLSHLDGLPQPLMHNAPASDPRTVIADMASRGMLTPHPDGGLVHLPVFPDENS